MTLEVWLALSALAAGAINAVAGGGTLLTFPALLSVLPERAANVTSTLALIPGSLGSAWGYRAELKACRGLALLLTLPCLIGGAIGALLLVRLPPGVFRALVPWLVLLAALLFALQPRLTARARARGPAGPPTRRARVALVAAQLLIGVYGGYFGAGIGILMLSALGVLGLGSIHQMNALKSYLGLMINAVALALFVAGGEIDYRYGLIMAASAVVGGYAGARLALRVPTAALRGVVVVAGFSLAAYFFSR